MDKARCNVVPPLATKPDGTLLDELATLALAARHWKVGDVRLDERLWTRSGPYWRGEIAKRLAQGSQASAQGFLLLLGSGVPPRALLSGHGAPSAVRHGLSGGIGTAGPHLALVACALEPTGQAVASHGFTQAVMSARCLMPVNSTFERDLLFLLVELQITLDAHGIDCAITRPFDMTSRAFANLLMLHFRLEGGALHELVIIMSDAPHVARSGEAGSFRLSPSQLSDGSFLDWLEIKIKTSLQAS